MATLVEMLGDLRVKIVARKEIEQQIAPLVQELFTAKQAEQVAMREIQKFRQEGSINIDLRNAGKPDPE